MKHLFLKNAALSLVVAAIAAPLAAAGNAAPPDSGTFYDGYKSGYPQLHATLSAHVTPVVPGRGFDWADASVGAGTAAGVIAILALSGLLLMRRRTRLAAATTLLSVVATAVFAVAGSAASTGSTPRSGDLQVTKECSQYTATAGSYCTITSSNIAAIKVGSRVVYASAVGDPTPGVLDSDLVIDGPGDNIAFGHVVLDLATLSGVVTFSGGTGEFAHFRAGPLAVACPAYPVRSWTGPYGFSPPS